MDTHFVFDIETVPLDLENYFQTAEENREQFLNPIDSKIIALGIRKDGENKVFIGEQEEEILEEFWLEWRAIRQGDKSVKPVGFNVKEFDLHHLTARSFANSVSVPAFKIKPIVDLRKRLSSFAWRPKGKLSDYAEATGITPPQESGGKVAEWYRAGNIDSIKRHLEEDLATTEELLERAIDLNITKIEKW